MDKRLLCVGKIVAAHGIRGEVKIQAFTQDPAMLQHYSPLTDSSGNQVVIAKVRSISGDILIASIDGIRTRTEAEFLRKKELFFPRDQLPEIKDENTFYLEDLKGLRVLHAQSREMFGTVKDIYNFGASDIIAVIRADNNQEEMFAFTHAIFPEINITEGYLLMDHEA